MNIRSKLRGPAKDLAKTLGVTEGVLKMWRNPAGPADGTVHHLVFRTDDGRVMRISVGDFRACAALGAMVLQCLARHDKSYNPTVQKLKRAAGEVLIAPEEDET